MERNAMSALIPQVGMYGMGCSEANPLTTSLAISLVKQERTLGLWIAMSVTLSQSQNSSRNILATLIGSFARSPQNPTLDQADCRLVLLLPDSGEVLAKSDSTSFRLPHISIPKWARPAEELQKAIRAVWGLRVIILDFPPSPEGSPL
jgi:hypothetical protein